MYTLRKKINEAKADFHEKGGRDEYWSETLAWTLQDYHSSKGSVLDFTEDDWHVCKENGFGIEEVCRLCDELWFINEVESLSWYLDVRMGDWKDSNGGIEREIKDEEVPQDVVTGFVSDFYTWRNDRLPVVEKIYANS